MLTETPMTHYSMMMMAVWKDSMPVKPKEVVPQPVTGGGQAYVVYKVYHPGQ